MKSSPPDLPADAANGDLEPGVAQRRARARDHVSAIAEALETEFEAGHRVLSFGEYLDLFAAAPARYGRSAPQYVRDMFHHYGSYETPRPWGHDVRYRLFDAPWRAEDPQEPRLLGHERLQAEIFRVLSNFAREGRANRLLLMHGPNGSAKSTAAACILRALEDYSQQDEGALYRFHWIFPTRKKSKGAIGFGGGDPLPELETYAHLDDRDIDARLVIELRDHPLFLLPGAQRRKLLDELWSDASVADKPSDWLYRGELAHKNKQIFEALLASYAGSLRDVLRHVQVERYFISRRYRVGAVTLGPEMSVDARERQITADRSVSALPTSLQATTLFEAHGELVEAAGGVLELSDLLKRPIDAFRYLQITLETGEVSLSQQTLFTNLVMLGSANDIHVAAFREHPEFASFRGRVELVRVPYLRNYLDERAIYDGQIVPQLDRHVAPHTTTLAAEFAVLSRLRRPDPDAYPKELAEVVGSLTAVEKLVLYAEGVPPERLSNEEGKLLRANVARIMAETDATFEYEGRLGMSPRLVRTLLLDAAQSREHACLSPFAVLKALDELCKRSAEFEWLKLKPLSGDYHDYAAFRAAVRERLLNRIERDMRNASALIDEEQYGELFRRYVTHVSAWLKGVTMRNEVTGNDEPADERIMQEVEGLLGLEGSAKEQRNTLISTIAAWAIDHQGETPRHAEIFPGYVQRMQTAAYAKLREPMAELLRSLVTLQREQAGALDADQRAAAEQLQQSLNGMGYNADSATDAASALLRERYTDLVS